MSGFSKELDRLSATVDELDKVVRLGIVAFLLGSIVATTLYFSMMYQIFWSKQ